MDANYYNGAPDDDDPEGDAHQCCPGCSARDGERCDADCTCGFCEQVDEDGPRGDEARESERDEQIDAFLNVK